MQTITVDLAQFKQMHERIAELETALRKWRDDYEHTKRHDGDPWVAVPIHQIDSLLL